jgi:ABC-type multidrug transport system fused ATPase/permease subunit
VAKQSSNSNLRLWRNLRRLWRALKADPISEEDAGRVKPMAIRAFGWLVLTEVFWLLQAYHIKLFVDLLDPNSRGSWLNHQQWASAWILAGATFVFFEMGSWVLYKQDVAVNAADWLYWIMINDFGTRKQLELGAEFHAEVGAAGKESVLGKNMKRVTDLLDWMIYMITPITVRIFITTAGISLIVWQLGLLTVITLLIWGAAFLVIEPKINKLRADYRQYTKRIEQEDSELAATALTIRELGLEDDLAEEHRVLLHEHLEKEIPRSQKFWRYILWEFRPVNLSKAAFIVVGLAAYQTGVSLSTIILASAWLHQVYANLWRYCEFQQILNEGEVALNELVELFETQPAIKQPVNPQYPAEPMGSIKMKDVWFSYKGSEEAALQDINLEIKPGMTVALVGPSGGGKSTLAKLIAHAYDPTKGSILVDGVDLREIDDKRYRREMLGVVPQVTGLFNRSIGRNISIVRAGARFDEVRMAAVQAGADSFIMKTKDGYETLIGENGIRLSGGQCQRVAIARALLRQPKILVLDEPTSSLDAISQQLVKQTLEQLAISRQATIVIIAHRFSTVEMADVVVVMKDGRIDGIGTHAELAKHNGLYNELRQLEGLLD